MEKLLNNQSNSNTGGKFVRIAGTIIVVVSALVFSAVGSGIGFVFGGPIGASILWAGGLAGGIFLGLKFAKFISQKI